MKKTLFLLSSLALAGASAQAATLCSTTFNRTGNSLDSVTVNSQSDYDLTASPTISNFKKGGNPAGGQSGDLLGQATTSTAVITPNSNVASGGSWSMSFTFTNHGTQDMLISSIDLSLIGVTGSGAPQNPGGGKPVSEGETWIGGTEGNTNKPINVNLSIEGGSSRNLVYNGATGTGSTGNWDELRTGSYDFMNGFRLGAGESLTITIDASKHDAYSSGCFAGLAGIQINGELAVPEPATASLGLLGLAVLLMRRRKA